MTRAQIQSRIYTKLGEESASNDRLSTTIVNAAIDDAYEQACVDTWAFARTAYRATADNVSEYDLPADVFRIRSLRYGSGSVTSLVSGATLNGNFGTAGAGGADVWGSWVEAAGNGTIADEGTLVHGGSHAAKLTRGTPTNASIYLTIAVTAGARYGVEFWTRGDGTVGGQYSFYDATNAAAITTATATGVTGAAYQRISTSVLAPVGCTSLRLYLYAPTAAGSAYFDDVVVQSMPATYTPLPQTSVDWLNLDSGYGWRETAKGTPSQWYGPDARKYGLYVPPTGRVWHVIEGNVLPSTLQESGCVATLTADANEPALPAHYHLMIVSYAAYLLATGTLRDAPGIMGTAQAALSEYGALANALIVEKQTGAPMLGG